MSICSRARQGDGERGNSLRPVAATIRAHGVARFGCPDPPAGDGYEVDPKASTSDPEESWFEHPDTHYRVLGKNVPDYSDTAVGQVVEKMREKGFDLVLNPSAGGVAVTFYRKWRTPPDGQSFEEWGKQGDAVPAAAPEICIKALAALGPAR